MAITLPKLKLSDIQSFIDETNESFKYILKEHSKGQFQLHHNDVKAIIEDHLDEVNESMKYLIKWLKTFGLKGIE